MFPTVLNICIVASFIHASPIALHDNRIVEVPVNVIEEAPTPYEFGYVFGNGIGMTQQRREVSDKNGVIRGQYGYLDPLGIYRTVNYTADANGYKAVIFSNEPGSTNQTPANAVYFVQPPPPAVEAERLRMISPSVAI